MNIGIIGAGNLGGAIAKLLHSNGYKKIMMADYRDLDIFSDFKRYSNIAVIQNSDILFLSVKPNNIEKVLDEINYSKTFQSNNVPNQLIVSCIAGVNINFLESYLNLKYPILRMMSNLPITYGKGSITYLANEIADDDLINQFIKLCSGPLFIEISKENEHLIDVSTILTGSMPAYLSFLSQIFIDFGNENGFSPEESRDLFVATLEGTKKMLESKSTKEVISSVSSPNGITAKGISYLESSEIHSILSTMLSDSYHSIKTMKKD